MTTYLTIITTVLVLTQIIRVAQNAFSLSKHSNVDKKNEEIMVLWKELAQNVADIASGVREEE